MILTKKGSLKIILLLQFLIFWSSFFSEQVQKTISLLSIFFLILYFEIFHHNFIEFWRQNFKMQNYKNKNMLNNNHNIENCRRISILSEPFLVKIMIWENWNFIHSSSFYPVKYIYWYNHLKLSHIMCFMTT